MSVYTFIFGQPGTKTRARNEARRLRLEARNEAERLRVEARNDVRRLRSEARQAVRDETRAQERVKGVYCFIFGQPGPKARARNVARVLRSEAREATKQANRAERKRKAKERGPTRLQKLWELERGPKMPPLETAGEYAREARAALPIIRVFGFKQSAITSPRLVAERYVRYQQFMGNQFDGVVWLLAKYLLPILVGIGVYLSVYIAEGQKMANLVAGMTDEDAASTLASTASNPALEGALGGIIFLVGIAVVSRSAQLIAKYNRAWADLTVVERCDPVDNMRITNLLFTKAERLSFVDSGGDYYSGPSRQAGVATGRMCVQLPAMVKLEEMPGMQAVWNLVPYRAGLTGRQASILYSDIAMAARLGELEVLMKESKFNRWLKDNGLLLIAGIELVVILMIVAGGN